MRKATLKDLDQLVSMMAEFYAEAAYTLNPRRAAEAFAPLLANEQLGSAWFIQENSRDIGYIVITLCYSMEYGGPCAVVDDFFIQRAFRGRGLGKAALAEVRSFCEKRGVRAIQVETGHDNVVAKAVCGQAGFLDTNRLHLTLKLDEPTHAP
jgi:GNAT superfamily N-acetyltransferase